MPNYTPDLQEFKTLADGHNLIPVYREISADLGVPENSIGPTLSRARERLKEGARP